MASSLALAACGEAGLEAAGTPMPEVVQGQQAQEAVAERRIILYRTPSGELYLADEDGVPQLVAPKATPPVFSPDGRSAAFSKLPDTWSEGDALESAELHVVDLSSRRVDQLTSGHVDLAPVWTPDGRYLLFVSNTRAEEPSFWRVRVNGTGLEQLALEENGPNGPNERRIILYLPAPVANSQVQWGPNERRIILYRAVGRDGAGEVRVASFSAAFEVESTSSLGEGSEPRWTEQGTIVFLRDGVEVEVSVE